MNKIEIDNDYKNRHNLTDRSIDQSISCIRLIAFCCIVICHIQQYLGNELCWWFNVGVQIFLAISGFLYGGKNVTDDVEFYGRKFKQILIPYYLTVLLFITIHFVFFRNLISSERVIRVLLCNATLEGGEHLWFVPTILMCYILTPLFQRLFDSNRAVLKTFTITAGGLFIAFKLFFPYFNAAWISCYFISFAIGFTEYHKKSLKKILIKTVLVLATICNTIQIVLTYIVRIRLDERSKVLFQVFCDYSHAFLGIAIFAVLSYILKCLFGKRNPPKMVDFIVKLSDEYSYEGYLVHQFFILGPMTMMHLTNCIGVNILAILITTLLFSFLLKKCERFVLNIRKKDRFYTSCYHSSDIINFLRRYTD